MNAEVERRPCDHPADAERIVGDILATNCHAHWCPTCAAWFRLGPDLPHPRHVGPRA